MKNWQKNTTIFIGSQMLSLMGSMLVQYAITWYITLQTQSGVYTMMAVICGFIPAFLLSPLAGVWADRYNRKFLIIMADSMIALTTLVVAILFMMGERHIWLLFIALVIRGLGNAVQTPCVNAMLPDIVPDEHLGKVNGINRSVQSLANLLSPIISGALLSVTNVESIFFVDVVTALIACLILYLFLKIPQQVKKEEKVSALADFKIGLIYTSKQRHLLGLCTSCILLWLISGALMYLPPLHVVRIFGNQVWYLTAIETASGIGLIIGGILFSIWGGFKKSVYTLFSSLLLMGGVVILLGYPRSFWFYVCLIAISWFLLSIFDTAATTMIQKTVDKEYIGRVFGILSMFSSCLMPLGMALFGPLADIISINIIFVFCGIVLVIVAFMVLNMPSLRKIEV